MAALLVRHAAITGGRRRAGGRGAAAERFLGIARQSAEAHAGDRDRRLQRDRLLREAGSKNDGGLAFLAIAFERIAGDRRTEEQQVVKVRNLALRAGSPDVVDASRGSAADFGQRVVVERR